MTSVLAIPTLFDRVQAILAADELGGASHVDMPFGWRAPGQTGVTPGTRVVWIPGDESGNLGALLAPKYPGGNPALGIARPLANLEELVTLEITGSDATPGNLENERAQYDATRMLFDRVVRALYLASKARPCIAYRYVSDKWITAKKERRYGAAIRLVLGVNAAIPDSPSTVTTAPVDTSASITIAELDQTDEPDSIAPQQ